MKTCVITVAMANGNNSLTFIIDRHLWLNEVLSKRHIKKHVIKVTLALEEFWLSVCGGGTKYHSFVF